MHSNIVFFPLTARKHLGSLHEEIKGMIKWLLTCIFPPSVWRKTLLIASEVWRGLENWKLIPL